MANYVSKTKLYNNGGVLNNGTLTGTITSTGTIEASNTIRIDDGNNLHLNSSGKNNITIGSSDGNDLVIDNTVTNGNIACKIDSTTNTNAFKIIDDTGSSNDNAGASTTKLHVGVDGLIQMSFETKNLTGSDVIASFSATSRFIFIDVSNGGSVSSSTSDITSTLNINTVDGQVVTIVYANDFRDDVHSFKLTINDYVPGTGEDKSNVVHEFPTKGSSITIVGYNSTWFHCNAGTITA